MESLQDCKVLVAEDEPELGRILVDFLSREQANVRLVRDGKSALDEARRWLPDLLLLDIRMPVRDGLSVLVAYREIDPHVPVILITALGDDLDRLTGFRLGADDYVVKPFNPLEVVARARAVLRRQRLIGDNHTRPVHFIAGNLRLESDSRRVFVGETLLNLTPSEFRILEALMGRPGRLLTRMTLAEDILDEETSDRSIDAHISRLRAKVGMDKAVTITTVRGEGYRLDVTS
jgi:two-component system, OmpR family, response regulator AdeR